MGCIHPFPTPQLLHALIKVRSVKNFKGSWVWQTVIKQEIGKKKKSAKAHGGSRADKCCEGSVLVINRLTAGHLLLAGSRAWAVNCEGVQKGQGQRESRAWEEQLYILSGYSSRPHPTPKPTAAPAQLQPPLLPLLLPKRKMSEAKSV